MWSALIDNIRIRSLSIGLVVVEICPLSYFHHRTSCVKNKKKPILLWGVSLTPLYEVKYYLLATYHRKIPHLIDTTGSLV